MYLYCVCVSIDMWLMCVCVCARTSVNACVYDRERSVCQIAIRFARFNLKASC